jgi:hypothetical protein
VVPRMRRRGDAGLASAEPGVHRRLQRSSQNRPARKDVRRLWGALHGGQTRGRHGSAAVTPTPTGAVPDAIDYGASSSSGGVCETRRRSGERRGAGARSEARAVPDEPQRTAAVESSVGESPPPAPYPNGRRCGCPPECICQRNAIGRVFRWYIPGRFHTPVPPDQKARLEAAGMSFREP